MKKKIQTPRAKKPSGRRSAPSKRAYQMEPASAHYGREMGWPVADGYQWTGKQKVPVRRDVFLGSDGFAWFAAINFRGKKFKILEPAPPKPSPKAKKRGGK